MRTMIYTTTAAAILCLSGTAFAQAPTPAPAAPAMSKAALSKSCSQQADTKGLHGKARKHFRSECKHGH